ncbi:lytic polysaccharide monooxygenase [Actinomadura kijaniata]|uniref:lytic polysaccharide monooxygenase n=1 Tax=Actinomadura kijaniata TaxID=46161 RepID=UPI00082B4C9D|nr:lytic polysaccharide monooxygenase [Actinomadura kijaniata]
MRRFVAYPLAAVAAAGSTLVVASPASAHGYVSSPPSRQALCAQRAVPDCGPIQFEPQSVEGPKGLRNCHANLGQFAVLSDESRNWPAKAVGTKVTFKWALTARHRTSSWEYFVGGTRVAVFNDGNRQPEAVVTHEVDLGKFPGRRTVLAVWNIGDTPMAFYNCVDLNVGGGSDPKPTTPPTTPAPQPTPTTSPTSTPTTRPTAQPTPTGTSGTGRRWEAGVTYRIGDEVTHDGVRYRCRQSHTAIRSWEPPFTLALWLPL